MNIPESKALHSILRSAGLKVPSGLANPLIKSITCDSRRVGVSSLFLGLPGENVDGGEFWGNALAAGAAAAVISAKAANLSPPSSGDVVVTLPEPANYWIGELAAAFWEYPSSRISLIGVTGTNGKTTVTHLIEHLCAFTGKPSALFGTLVNRWPSHSGISTHTTAFADVLQGELAAAVEAGASLGAMEVSSHALAQYRVAGCHFAGAIFTNLTQDHLDYHLSMDDYFATKARLFRSPLLNSATAKAVVNIDDEWGERLAKELGGKCWRSSLAPNSFRTELSISEMEMTPVGVKGLLHSPVGKGRFHSPLVGRFNLMNFLQAVGALLQQGLPLNELLAGIVEFPGVPGRMERVVVADAPGQLPFVIVDYAHTPDGLRNALLATRPFVKGNLVCVFGCGGDRDRGKRPQMGRVAAELSDELVLTSDNPRTEDPVQILRDVLTGIASNKKLTVETDRALAIDIAISHASPDDVVLIAGKGHEDYQILGLEKFQFDDREKARQALKRKLVAN